MSFTNMDLAGIANYANIEWIGISNYLEIFKDEVLHFGKELMKQFEQNRILIIYTDETIMLEQSNKNDPRILI